MFNFGAWRTINLFLAAKVCLQIFLTIEKNVNIGNVHHSVDIFLRK
nr:hypothetical protein Iba_chr04fCG11840 [Ipomoea batatas]